MLVAQDPVPNQNSYNPNQMGSFEDFFNFDLLNANGPSSSRSSSQSPTNSLANLPQTPIVDSLMPVDDLAMDASSAEPLFGDFYNMMSDPAKSQAGSQYSFLEPLSADASPFFDNSVFSSFPSSSSDSQTSPDATSPSAVSPSMTLAIDPALMAQSEQPSFVSQNRDLREIPEELTGEEGDDDDIIAVSPAATSTSAKGRGKGGRKGTVASGGIRKNSASGGAPIMTQAVRRETDPRDDDDWRPSPEEYKKMSSKEKRQLRNKISARNFRVRRKEYISTLEGDIADRDNLIDAIRNELGNTKLENQSLRQEVEALKRALLDGGIKVDLPPPAPLAVTPPITSSPALTPASLLASKDVKEKEKEKEKKEKNRPALLAKPNTQKDLPSSPRLKNAGGFWGGRMGSYGGGVTPVHTTLVPDLAPLISDKLAAVKAKPLGPPHLQENLNPMLNGNPFFGVGSTPTPNNAGNVPPKQPFDAFSDRTPFTLKNLDLYRMSLWGQVGAQRAQQNTRPSSNSPMDGLVGQMRPSYFATPKTSTTLSAILSGKGTSSNIVPTPPSPIEKKPSLPPTSPTPTPQQATIATIASQTLLKKMSSAFWDAFSTPSSGGNWDSEKVRKVLEGSAVVRVVDVSKKKEPQGVDALEESMKNLAIGSQGGSPPSLKDGPEPTLVKMKSEPCFLKNIREGVPKKN